MALRKREAVNYARLMVAQIISCEAVSVVGTVEASEPAVVVDAPIGPRKEVHASGMEQRLLRKNAIIKVAPTMSSEEECALDTEQKPRDATMRAALTKSRGEEYV